MNATYSEVLKKLETDNVEIGEMTEFSILIKELPKEKRQIAEGFVLGLFAAEQSAV